PGDLRTSTDRFGPRLEPCLRSVRNRLRTLAFARAPHAVLTAAARRWPISFPLDEGQSRRARHGGFSHPSRRATFLRAIWGVDHEHQETLDLPRRLHGGFVRRPGVLGAGDSSPGAANAGGNRR